MVFKFSLIIASIFVIKIMAETPLQSAQDQESSGPYQPSGWRPGGPSFRLPERPLTFQVRPKNNLFDLTYSSPQDTKNVNNQEQSYFKAQSGSPQQRYTNQGINERNEPKTENQVHPTYSIPQETLAVPPNGPAVTYGPPEIKHFGSPNDFKLFKPTAEQQNSESQFKRQRSETENQVNLTYGIPQETLSVPPNEPAVTYGPPTAKHFDSPSDLKPFKLPAEQQNSNSRQQVDFNYSVPKADYRKINVQEETNANYPVFQQNKATGQSSVRFNTPNIEINGQRSGIEYQVDLTYGTPQETLAAPPNRPPLSYGIPEEEITTDQPESTTTELPTTTETATEEVEHDESEKDNQVQKEDLKEDVEEVNEEGGEYYIYHPNGLLQKVVYAAKDDQTNMAYSAQLKYENIEPIRGPVYTYDPQTFVFKRLY